jgi:hypothetical protein
MVERFPAPGPWITRDLKLCVLASDHDAAIAQLTRERDEALKAVDENWVTHQRVIAANNERDALAADVALHREALDWALGHVLYGGKWPHEFSPSVNPPPPHLAAILDASRKRVCGHE